MLIHAQRLINIIRAETIRQSMEIYHWTFFHMEISERLKVWLYFTWSLLLFHKTVKELEIQQSIETNLKYSFSALMSEKMMDLASYTEKKRDLWSISAQKCPKIRQFQLLLSNAFVFFIHFFKEIKLQQIGSIEKCLKSNFHTKMSKKKKSTCFSTASFE